MSLKGHDSYPGTALKPWATLQYAVDSIQHGDTILVQAGTYAGCRIEMPGVQNSPKVLMAAPGAHVVLNRPGAHNKHNSIIEIENFSSTVADWIVAGFEVSNSPKYGIDVRVTERITVQQNHVHNSALTSLLRSPITSSFRATKPITTGSMASTRATAPSIPPFERTSPITTLRPAFT